jgi:hypothetical protein
VNGGGRPAGQGPSGSSAPGKLRIRSASGPAAAKANAAGGLEDPGGYFQEPKTQRRELGSGQFLDFGNGVAHGQHQPISGRMEHETDLVGERRRQLVRSEANCVLCSLIRFSAWPRAQYRLS